MGSPGYDQPRDRSQPCPSKEANEPKKLRCRFGILLTCCVALNKTLILSDPHSPF